VSNTFNIYCDESCHLEGDHQPVMVLGAICCPLDKVREISTQIRKIKTDHGLKPNFEVKWTKVSPAKLSFYNNILDCFFDNEDLHFRCLVIPDKSKLDHEKYNQDHNTWYYKMYFEMLKVMLEPTERYRIYLDIKDTCGGQKVAKLYDVLCRNLYDFSREIIERIQLIRSHEVEILQLTDLLIGSVSYANRSAKGSLAKLALVNSMKSQSGYSLTQTTLLREKKVNIFIWRATDH